MIELNKYIYKNKKLFILFVLNYFIYVE